MPRQKVQATNILPRRHAHILTTAHELREREYHLRAEKQISAILHQPFDLQPIPPKAKHQTRSCNFLHSASRITNLVPRLPGFTFLLLFHIFPSINVSALVSPLNRAKFWHGFRSCFSSRTGLKHSYPNGCYAGVDSSGVFETEIPATKLRGHYTLHRIARVRLRGSYEKQAR